MLTKKRIVERFHMMEPSTPMLGKCYSCNTEVKCEFSATKKVDKAGVGHFNISSYVCECPNCKVKVYMMEDKQLETIVVK